jgi:hypothetical protein
MARSTAAAMDGSTSGHSSASGSGGWVAIWWAMAIGVSAVKGLRPARHS